MLVLMTSVRSARKTEKDLLLGKRIKSPMLTGTKTKIVASRTRRTMMAGLLSVAES